MTYDYDEIKELAKQNGQKVTDYLALSPKNDPFYAGTPTDIEQGRWFASVWKAAGYSSGVHLRRAHYWCVSNVGFKMHNGDVYQNTDKCWDYLVQASKMARYLHYVEISDIIDNKNPAPNVHAEYFSSTPRFEIQIPDLAAPDIWLYGLYNANVQPYHLEVWCEKSTMNDVLMPICAKYGANLVTFEGEVSITACYNLAQRIERADKPARIFYISDFDPAGKSMPVATSRKVEWMLQELNVYEADVRVRALVLNLEQIQQYNLPRTPIKESERRAGKFEEAFGVGAVELDALEALYAGVLGQIVDEALEPYYSRAAAREVNTAIRDFKAAVQVKIDVVTSDYQEHIDKLREMFDKLREITVDTEDYHVDPHIGDVYEYDEEWLFDSTRDYEDQIAYYKRHKGKAED